MKLAKVVGTVVLSRCVDAYVGKALHLTQDLDESLAPVGDPEVSTAWQPVNEGEVVIVEMSRESANAFDPPIPIDSVILGKVETIHIEA